MKYKVLLIGRNKLMMGELFQYLDEEFEIQTSSMRNKDIMSHINYFRPDAIFFCMNKEEKERTDVVASLKSSLEKYKISLILIGDQNECEGFKNSSGGMGDLLLKKPISVRNIKEKAIQFLGEKKAAATKDPLQSACDIANELIKEISEDKNLSHIAQRFDESTDAKPKSTASVSKAAESAHQPSASTHQPATPVPQKSNSAVQGESGDKKHVLVVDDDPMMLKLIKEQLKDSYTVATAINGVIALKFLESKKTDLIILDYEMPGQNGAQVLEKIRQNSETAKLPVIFLTGIKDREKIKKVVELKPQGYLLKPIESEKLIRSIKSIIG